MDGQSEGKNDGPNQCFSKVPIDRPLTMQKGEGRLSKGLPQVYTIILNIHSNAVHEKCQVLAHSTCFNVKLAFNVKFSENWCSCRLREGEWLSQGHRAETSQCGTGSPNSWFHLSTCHLHATFSSGFGCLFPNPTHIPTHTEAVSKLVKQTTFKFLPKFTDPQV